LAAQATASARRRRAGTWDETWEDVPVSSGPRRFELVRKLGDGTFGELHEARDREHGTRVALKSLKSMAPDWVYRFKREFRTVSELAHRNLLHVHELFSEDGRWHLTMELIDGTELDAYLAREPTQLRSCFAQLALGLHELHRAGSVHRDLKPSNVLVERAGRVVLLDFGLSLPQQASSRTRLAGTPLYLAPEVGLGHPPSEIADWYAFGVMLYEELAGHKPFSGDDVAMLRLKLAEPPPSPSTLRPGCDAALATLSLRLLDRDPVKRPRGEEVLRELGVPASEIDVIARRYAPVELVGREHELDALEDALAAVEDAPVVVTVRGGPGTGKTALVRRFLKGIRKRAQSFYGRCRELENVTFKGLDGAIDMLSTDLRYRQREIGELIPDDVSALVHLFPALARVPAFVHPTADTRSAKGLRGAGIDAFGDLLGLMSVSAPVVLFLDDLQWVNDETVRVLLELLATNPPPVLLVLAFRDGDPPPALARLLAGLHDRVRDVDLPPLDLPAIGELLATRPDLTLAPEAVLRETGGHPALVGWQLAGGLAQAVAALDPDARHLLEVIARAGGPLGKAEATAAIANGAIVVEQLRRRRFIQVQNDRLDVYHPRVREVVLG
jgi:hypothetical protein